MRSSFGRCALVGSLTVALLLPGTPAGAAAGQLSDPAGDPVDADTGDRVAEPRADITGASVEYQPGRITFRLQVSQPTDPMTDPGWPQEASTAAWGVDVDNDQQPDYIGGAVRRRPAGRPPRGGGRLPPGGQALLRRQRVLQRGAGLPARLRPRLHRVAGVVLLGSDHELRRRPAGRQQARRPRRRARRRRPGRARPGRIAAPRLLAAGRGPAQFVGDEADDEVVEAEDGVVGDVVAGGVAR